MVWKSTGIGWNSLAICLPHVSESFENRQKCRKQARSVKALEFAEVNAESLDIPFGDMDDAVNEHSDFVVCSVENRQRLICIEHFQVDAGGRRKHGVNQS